MDSSFILNLVLGFIAVWFVGVVVFALIKAADKKYDPLPPERLEHHGHGDEHGHEHGVEAHAEAQH